MPRTRIQKQHRSLSPEQTGNQEEGHQNDRSRIINFKFDKFDNESEEWEYWVERFEIELQLYDINPNNNNTRARDLILSKIGPDVFKSVIDHFRPNNIRTVPYNDIRAMLTRHYGRRVFILAERKTFAETVRNDNDSILTFINRLKRIASRCNFGKNLEERIRDQLVIGINNTKWQQTLIKKFPENSASLVEVEGEVLLLEQIKMQYEMLNTEHGTDKINTVKSNDRQRTDYRQTVRTKKVTLVKGRDCFKCGNFVHKNRQCSALGQKCLACGGEDHFARVCLKTGRAEIILNNKSTNKLDLDDKTDSDTELRSLNTINGLKAMLEIEIENRKIEMLYDPGAAVSVIGSQLWHELGKPELEKVSNLVAYTNHQIETKGKIKVKVTAFGKTKQLSLYVIETNDIPLFGFDWVLAFNLQLPTGAKICNTLTNAEKLTEKGRTEKLDNLLDKYKILFEDKLGSIKRIKAVIHLNEGATSRVSKPRGAPFALKPQIEEEIKRLVERGVIEPVDPMLTPIRWASPIEIQIKPTGKIRLCANFKHTLNPHIIPDQHPLPTFEEISVKLSGGGYILLHWI